MKAKREEVLTKTEFRPLVESDLADLASLVLGMKNYGSDQFWLKTIDADYYRWMYFGNPAGKAHTCAAFHEGRLVASFSISPRRMQMGGEVVSAGKTMDMFTHPDYQGLGLMSMLTGACFASAQKAGIKNLYVTPSDNSYPIFLKKFGYVEPFHVHYMIKVLNLGPVIRKKLNVTDKEKHFTRSFDGAVAAAVHHIVRWRYRDCETEEVEGFDGLFDDLWNESRKPAVAIVRDRQYLSWRYVDHPDRYRIFKVHKRGRVAGFFVLKMTRRRGYEIGEVVDFFSSGRDEGMSKVILGMASDIIRREGCMAAQLWSIKGSASGRRNSRAGFRIRRKKMHFLLSRGCTVPVYYDPDSWFLTQGDGNDI